ncbi:galactokinase [Flavobacterium alkalisoli]|uniref:Galactokinase n=1 Tax=Flavobacterium alkalisoli TaxID=2602769 RepID=A0A5B9FPA7_9FLAO|nr:galactokinase [Flavobacterium alkalisoli]QEE48159.1 galactokinase [Flavobacterium alkalisoli]
MDIKVKQEVPASLEPYIQQGSIVSFAPGRINLLGEHTDYNNGFVMPASIDKRMYFVLNPRTDNTIHLHSLDMNQEFSVEVENLAKTNEKTWVNYILGVVDGFINKGYSVNGFDAVFTGNIPIGAGVSSSAALECAVAVAVNKYTKAGLDNSELALVAQKAEHKYAGVKCGIMDQFASIFGKGDTLIKLDCRTLQYEYKPLKLEGASLLLFDSDVKHSLASSEYNVRRQQCEEGVAMVKKYVPLVDSLRDISLEMLDNYVYPNDKTVYNRCRYVVEENQRVQQVAAFLEAGNLKAVGQKMFETHEGLRSLYEVSCEELDFLVTAVRDNEDVLGARLMGGGFGGCTINLVKNEAVNDVISKVSESYYKQYKKELKVYPVSIGDGATVIKNG